MFYATIKLLHLTGLMLTFFGFGGMLMLPRAAANPPRGLAMLARWSHGLGLILLLVTGFIMLRNLGLMEGDIPHWSKVKLLILVALGAFTPIAKRQVGPAWGAALVFILLGISAGYLGLFKPF